MSDLLELAGRCEDASGPDFWIDRAICEIVQPEAAVGFAQPDYTASLDAAMLLVPDGVEAVPLSFKLERYYFGNGMAKCRASVWCGLGGVSSLDTASEAVTPALALAAACLRARALSTPQATDSGVDLDPPMKRI